MLDLDELLESAAGPIEPTFDLDDIAAAGVRKQRRRRLTRAAVVSASCLAFLVLAVTANQLARPSEPLTTVAAPGVAAPGDAGGTPDLVIPGLPKVQVSPACPDDDPSTPCPPPVFLEALHPAAGEPVARLVINAIDLDVVVVEGVGVDALMKGPGHYPETSLPGQPGNAAIAGHHDAHGAPFARLYELTPGNRISVQTLQGLFVYQVTAQDDGLGHHIVGPEDVGVIEPQGDNRLTLTATHPELDAGHRLVVVAHLLGEPVGSFRDAGEAGALAPR